MLESILTCLGAGIGAGFDDPGVRTTLRYVQYVGVGLSFLGAVLVAMKTAQLRRTGFGIWVLSNMCLIAWALSVTEWGLLSMYLVFTVTSSCGWWNNRQDASGG